MGTRVATVIIEPRLLVREALELLMGNHSYRVVCGVGSLADIDSTSIATGGPQLVILGTQSADNAVSGADGVRKLWPDSKIILLFDYASPADFQKLVASQIDGCVPLSVSPDTLIGTLDLIVTRHVRVMVVGDTKRPSISRAQGEESHQAGAKFDGAQSSGIEHEGTSIAQIAMPYRQTPNAIPSGLNGSNGSADYVPQLPRFPKLSERETQILDGLVKGHANKVIARLCDITEATVKVHMKSILRKIQVGNRTQAAIWALEHGYPADEIKDRALKSAARPHNGAS